MYNSTHNCNLIIHFSSNVTDYNCLYFVIKLHDRFTTHYSPTLNFGTLWVWKRQCGRECQFPQTLDQQSRFSSWLDGWVAWIQLTSTKLGFVPSRRKRPEGTGAFRRSCWLKPPLTASTPIDSLTCWQLRVHMWVSKTFLMLPVSSKSTAVFCCRPQNSWRVFLLGIFSKNV